MVCGQRLAALILAIGCSAAHADMSPEPFGTVAELDTPYPVNWVVIHDAAFFHMLEGKLQIVDPLAPTLAEQFHGMLPASFIAAYEFSPKRGEHYVIETFFARGSRGGDRTDVVTVWDARKLTVVDEIEIPAKRLSGMPKTTSTALTRDQRFLAIYNFTPAQSLSIVDLERREFVTEIPLAGCGFVIASGKRGLTSICQNGTFLTQRLDRRGHLAGTSRTAVAFDSEDDPVFEAPAIHARRAYFVTFQGEIVPLELRSKPTLGERWPLNGEGDEGWRPGGMNVISADAAGRLYVLMHPDGREGTHKDGGSEVWVFDPETKTRLDRVTLRTHGISLATAGEEDGRLLLVTTAEMGVDVYRATSGEFVHTLRTGAETPFLIHSLR